MKTMIRKTLALGLRLPSKAVAFSAATAAALVGLHAFAATTPIVTVDGTSLTVLNTQGNAGKAGWGTAGTICIPVRLNLPAGTPVKLSSFTFWVSPDVTSGTKSYADTITIALDSQTSVTTQQYTGSPNASQPLVYSFASGSEPTLSVGTTYSLTFTMRSGFDGTRYTAAEKGSGSDGFFNTGHADYAPRLQLAGTITGESTSFYVTTINADKWWSDLAFTKGGQTAPWVSGSDVKVTVTGTPTLQSNNSIGNLYLVGSGDDDVLDFSSDSGTTITKASLGIPMNVKSGNFNIGGLSLSDRGQLTFDASAGSYTIGNDTTKAMIRASNDKIYFKGSGSNGATLDYGNGNNTPINSHLMFEGGKHVLKDGKSQQTQSFSETGSEDNPTVLVKNGTTLDYYLKDQSGWGGSRVDTAVVRVASGATMNIKYNGGTMFTNGRWVLEPGSTTTVDSSTNTDGLRIYGGQDKAKAQLYVPAPASGAGSNKATLSKADGSSGFIKLEGPSAVTVDTGAILEVNGPIKGTAEWVKGGAGTLRLTGDTSGYTGNLWDDVGTIELAGRTDFNLNIPVKGIKGVLRIAEDAKYTAKNGDSVNYDGNGNVEVYGTLDMSDKRWTFFSNNKLYVYAGGTVTGTGDTNGALDMNKQNTIYAKDSASENKTATISAVAKLQNPLTFEVDAGVTLNYSGTLKYTSNKTHTKSGAGTLVLSGTQDSATDDSWSVSAGTLVLNLATVPYTGIAISSGATLECPTRGVTLPAITGNGQIKITLTDEEITAAIPVTIFTCASKADAVSVFVTDSQGRQYTATASSGSYSVDPTAPLDVAQIGDNKYKSVSLAVAAVAGTDQTVQLLRDSVEAVTTDKTFTLDLNGKTLGGSLNIAAAGAVTMANASTFASAITGAGTLVYSGVLPNDTVKTALQTSTWTGTLWLKNYNWNAFDFETLGNLGSKVKLTGVSGYATNAQKICNTELVLEDDGTTKALTINNGWSGGEYAYTVAKLSGTGTWQGVGNVAQNYVVTDGTGFSGNINLSNGTIIIFGATYIKTEYQKGGFVYVEPGKTVAVSEGKTWTANGGIQINGTIGGAGTLASATMFGAGATIDARNGTLTANGTLAFGANTKVRVTTAPAVIGDSLKIVGKSGEAGAIETIVTAYEGDSADPVIGGFKLEYKTDGVYLTRIPRTVYAASTVTEVTDDMTVYLDQACTMETTLAADDTLVFFNAQTVVFNQTVTLREIKVIGGVALTVNNGSDGYTFNGETVNIENGTVKLNLDSNDPKVSDATFVIGASGELTNNGWLTFDGEVTINSDSDKTILNNSGGTISRIRGTGTIVKTGTGKITFASIPQEGSSAHPITISAGALALATGGNAYSLGAVAIAAGAAFEQPSTVSADRITLAAGSVLNVTGAAADEYTITSGPLVNQGGTIQVNGTDIATAGYQVINGKLVKLPEPVVVWNRDFDVTTKGDFTLDANGNAVAADGSLITIGSDKKGVLVDWNPVATTDAGFKNKKLTVLVRYANLKSVNNIQLLSTIKGGTTGNETTAAYLDRVGFLADKSSVNPSHYAYGVMAAALSTTGTRTGVPCETSETVKYMATTYDASLDGYAAYFKTARAGGFGSVYSNNAVKYPNENQYGVAIGGPRSVQTWPAATDMKIQAIAIFNTVLSPAQMQAYVSGDFDEPTKSLGFDGGKDASTVVGGTPLTGDNEWGSPTYVAVRGGADNKAMTISSGTKPYYGTSPVADNASWSINIVAKLADVQNGVLFGVSGAMWDAGKKGIGLERTNADTLRVSYTHKTAKQGAYTRTDFIDNIHVDDTENLYHSYLLTYNNDAKPYYTLYVDGVWAGDSGDAEKFTGYAAGFCIGNYYGGATEVGAKVFEGMLVDDVAIWAGTCLTAAQAKTLAARFPTWASRYAATIDADANFSAIGWSPSLNGGTRFAGSEFVLTSEASAALTTVTVDQPFTIGKLTVVGAAGKEVKFAGFGDMTASSFDFSAALGGVGFDVAGGWTVPEPLRNYLRDNETKVTFYGSDSNGATLTYASDESKAFKSHLVFNGGVHTFKYGKGDSGNFAVNATAANPTLLVKNGTTLNLHGRDLGGWTGTANLNAIVQVDAGGKLYAKKYDGTFYYHQRFTINPGAELWVDATDTDNFRLEGGVNADATQIYVPDGSGTACIKPADAAKDAIHLHHDVTRGVGITVGTGATLDIQTKITCENDSNAYEIGKYGVGLLKLSGDISGYWQQSNNRVVKFSAYAGGIDLATASAVKCGLDIASDANLLLTGNGTTVSGVISGDGVVVRNGTGTVTLSGANTYSGGTTVSAGTLKLTGSGTIGTGDYSVAADATLDLGTCRPSGNLIGTSAGLVIVNLNAGEENATFLAGDELEILNVSGDAFAGTITVYDADGVQHELASKTVVGGKLVIVKTQDERVSPFNLTTLPEGGMGWWTDEDLWTDSSSPAQAVVAADWANKVGANVALKQGEAAQLFLDPSQPVKLSVLNIANSGTFVVSDEYGGTLTADEIRINNAGSVTLTSIVGTGTDITAANIDDDESTGNTTINFALGAANVVAGANTVLGYAGTGTLTIGVDKKATVPAWSGANLSGAGMIVYNAASAETAVEPGAFSANFTGNIKLTQGTWTCSDNYPQTRPVTLSGANAKFVLNKQDGMGYDNNLPAFTVENGATFEVDKRDTFNRNLVLNNGKFVCKQDDLDSGRAFDFYSAAALTVSGTSTIGGLMAESTTDSGILSVRRDDFVVTVNESGLLKCYSQWRKDEGNGNFTKSGAGTWEQYRSAHSSATFAFTLDAGTLKLIDGGAVTTGGMTISDGATLELNASEAQTVANAISGGGSLVKTGVGTLTLTGANTYTGTTTVEGGTLKPGAIMSGGYLIKTGASAEFDIDTTVDGYAKPTIAELGGTVTITAKTTTAKVITGASISIATLPAGTGPEKVAVVLKDKNTDETIASDVAIDATTGALTVKLHTDDFTLTPSASDNFTWAIGDAGSSFDNSKKWADFGNVWFKTTPFTTAVTTPSFVKASNVKLGGAYNFGGSPLMANTLTTVDGAATVFANDVAATDVAVTNGTAKFDALVVDNKVAVSNAQFEASVIGPSMRFVRLTITATQTSGNQPAVGEFRLYRGSATTGYSIVDWPKGTKISDCTGYSSTKTTSSYPGEVREDQGRGGHGGNEQQPGTLIDGYYGDVTMPKIYNPNDDVADPMHNKWWPTSKSSQPWTVTIEFPYPVATFSGCNFCLADHAPRNPTAWTIEISNDGQTWEPVNNTTEATWGEQFQWGGGGENTPAFLNTVVTPTAVEVKDGSTVVADGKWTAALNVSGDVTFKGVAEKNLTLDAASTSSFATGAHLTFDLTAFDVTKGGKQYIIAGPTEGWPAIGAITIVPEGSFDLAVDEKGYYVESHSGNYWIGDGEGGAGTWDFKKTAAWGETVDSEVKRIWLNEVPAVFNRNASVTIDGDVGPTKIVITNNERSVAFSGNLGILTAKPIQVIGTNDVLTVATDVDLDLSDISLSVVEGGELTFGKAGTGTVTLPALDLKGGGVAVNAGTVVFAGSGTYGTITMSVGAVAKVGNRRNLAFAGAGTVDVTLTQAEYDGTEQITAFVKAEDATQTAVGRVFGPGEMGEITSKVTIDGNKITITHAAKIGTTFYLTLADAIKAANAAETAEGKAIVLLADCTIAETVAVASGVSISFGTYSVTVDVGSGYANLINGTFNGATVALKSGQVFFSKTQEVSLSDAEGMDTSTALAQIYIDKTDFSRGGVDSGVTYEGSQICFYYNGVNVHRPVAAKTDQNCVYLPATELVWNGTSQLSWMSVQAWSYNVQGTTEEFPVTWTEGMTNAVVISGGQRATIVAQETVTPVSIKNSGSGYVTIINNGTLGPTSLSGTPYQLAGTGTFGELTVSGNPTIYVQPETRGLTFAGGGVIGVMVSAAEYVPGKAVEVFEKAQGATTRIAVVYRDGNDVTGDANLVDGVITFKNEADIGSAKYFTLSKAIAAAQANDTIKVLTDVANVSFDIDKTLTIDAGVNKLTGTGFSVISDDATLTIVGGYIGVTTLSGTHIALTGGKYTESGKTQFADRIASGYHFAGLADTSGYGDYKYQIIAGAEGKSDEKVYPVSTDTTTAGYAGELAFTKQQLVAAGVIASAEVEDSVVAEKLNEKAPNNNQKWENVVLGLSNTEATDVPVVAPVQGTSTTQVSLKLGSNVKVDTTTGAKVTYKVLSGDGSTWTEEPGEWAHGATATVDLPSSGVKYFKFAVAVTPAK